VDHFPREWTIAARFPPKWLVRSIRNRSAWLSRISSR
jgi:hypothetical protein